MKILVVSDTHGYTAPLVELVNRYADQIQMVIHLGDRARDLLDLESKYPDTTMVAVAGNIDFRVDAEAERILSLEGRKILLLHGHRQGVKSGMDRLFYYAKEKGVDVCLFGHTHMQARLMKEDIIFMNPGSLVEPRGFSRAGYGFLNISQNGEIFAELISL